MKFIKLVLILILAIPAAAQFRIEGHRGARGYVPENTIPSFIKALEQGADTIELDVVVSADGKLVVSHEPWFSHIIATDPKGNPIDEKTEKEHNIFKLKYDEIRRYDVGSIGNKGFPEQVKMKAVKPLLRDVFKAVNAYAKKHKLKAPYFNVEIKSNPDWDDKFTPGPTVMAKLVYDEIVRSKMTTNVIVQSFDVRPLQELRKLPVRLPIALLVGNKDGIEKSVARLGFDPDTYSPHFSLLDDATVKFCRDKGIKLVPWTVNEIADLEKVKTFKTDGVITDFPDRAVKVFKN